MAERRERCEWASALLLKLLVDIGNKREGEGKPELPEAVRPRGFVISPNLQLRPLKP